MSLKIVNQIVYSKDRWEFSRRLEESWRNLTTGEIDILFERKNSWMISWIVSGPLEDVIDIYQAFMRQPSTYSAITGRYPAARQHTIGNWLCLRVSDKTPEARKLLEREPGLFPSIASYSEDPELRKEAIDAGYASYVAKNPHITRQEAIDITFADPEVSYRVGVLGKMLCTEMSYAFLARGFFLLEKFEEDIQELDPETYNSLRINWEGSLKDLIKACKELS